jgi:pyridoxine kinase
LGRKESAGYTTVKGQVLNGDQLWTLMEGLEANDLLHYTHLLTGAKFTSLSNLLNLCFPGFIAAFYISLISSYSIHIAFFPPKAGYIGSVSFLEKVLHVVEKLRTVNPNLIYGMGKLRNII